MTWLEKRTDIIIPLGAVENDRPLASGKLLEKLWNSNELPFLTHLLRLVGLVAQRGPLHLAEDAQVNGPC